MFWGQNSRKATWAGSEQEKQQVTTTKHLGVNSLYLALLLVPSAAGSKCYLRKRTSEICKMEPENFFLLLETESCSVA